MTPSQKKFHLIQQLKKRAQELGQIPNHLQMGGAYPSYLVYEEYFGSWNQAVQAAGLDYSKQFIPSKKEAVAILQKASLELKKKKLDLSVINNYESLMRKEASRWPKPNVLIRILAGKGKNWNNAIIAAGLTPSVFVNISRKRAMAVLKSFRKELLKSGELFNYPTFQKYQPTHIPDTVCRAITGHNNRWREALFQAGLIKNRPSLKNEKIPTKEEAITILKSAYEELAKQNLKLTYHAYQQLRFKSHHDWPSIQKICLALVNNPTSFIPALKVAGVPTARFHSEYLSPEKAKEILKMAAVELAKNKLRLTCTNYTKLKYTRHPEWPLTQMLSKVLMGNRNQFAKSLTMAEIPISSRFPSKNNLL